MGQVVYIGSIREYLELDKKKTKDPDKFRKIEIIYDLNKIRKERSEMTDKSNDEKRFTKEEAKVNTYMAEHKGVSYREACLAVLDSSEGLGETKEEFTDLTSDEIIRAKKMIDDIIYNLSLAKKSDSFRKIDQDKLDKAYNLVKEVEESVKILVEKNA
jgi:hypothetical protein